MVMYDEGMNTFMRTDMWYMGTIATWLCKFIELGEWRTGAKVYDTGPVTIGFAESGYLTRTVPLECEHSCDDRSTHSEVTEPLEVGAMDSAPSGLGGTGSELLDVLLVTDWAARMRGSSADCTYLLQIVSVNLRRIVEHNEAADPAAALWVADISLSPRSLCSTTPATSSHSDSKIIIAQATRLPCSAAY